MLATATKAFFPLSIHRDPVMPVTRHQVQQQLDRDNMEDDTEEPPARQVGQFPEDELE